jgi:hypothetical protein
MTKHFPLAQSPRPTPPTGGAAGRGAVNSLVQGSLVDLFAAYNVGLAPLPATWGSSWPVPEVSAAAAFKQRATGEPGRLTLSLTTSLLDQMKGAEAATVKMDWARELTSQLLGRIKNRLLHFGVQLEVGALSLLSAQAVEERLKSTQGTRVYAARTLRGLVLVTLQGLPEDATLNYVGAASTAEGTLIWL